MHCFETKSPTLKASITRRYVSMPPSSFSRWAATFSPVLLTRLVRSVVDLSSRWKTFVALSTQSSAASSMRSSEQI